MWSESSPQGAPQLTSSASPNQHASWSSAMLPTPPTPGVYQPLKGAAWLSRHPKPYRIDRIPAVSEAIPRRQLPLFRAPSHAPSEPPHPAQYASTADLLQLPQDVPSLERLFQYEIGFDGSTHLPTLRNQHQGTMRRQSSAFARTGDGTQKEASSSGVAEGSWERRPGTPLRLSHQRTSRSRISNGAQDTSTDIPVPPLPVDYPPHASYDIPDNDFYDVVTPRRSPSYMENALCLNVASAANCLFDADIPVGRPDHIERPDQAFHVDPLTRSNLITRQDSSDVPMPTEDMRGKSHAYLELIPDNRLPQQAARNGKRPLSFGYLVPTPQAHDDVHERDIHFLTTVPIKGRISQTDFIDIIDKPAATEEPRVRPIRNAIRRSRSWKPLNSLRTVVKLAAVAQHAIAEADDGKATDARLALRKPPKTGNLRVTRPQIARLKGHKPLKVAFANMNETRASEVPPPALVKSGQKRQREAGVTGRKSRKRRLVLGTSYARDTYADVPQDASSRPGDTRQSKTLSKRLFVRNATETERAAEIVAPGQQSAAVTATRPEIIALPSEQSSFLSNAAFSAPAATVPPQRPRRNLSYVNSTHTTTSGLSHNATSVRTPKPMRPVKEMIDPSKFGLGRMLNQAEYSQNATDILDPEYNHSVYTLAGPSTAYTLAGPSEKQTTASSQPLNAAASVQPFNGIPAQSLKQLNISTANRTSGSKASAAKMPTSSAPCPTALDKSLYSRSEEAQDSQLRAPDTESLTPPQPAQHGPPMSELQQRHSQDSSDAPTPMRPQQSYAHNPDMPAPVRQTSPTELQESFESGSTQQLNELEPPTRTYGRTIVEDVGLVFTTEIVEMPQYVQQRSTMTEEIASAHDWALRQLSADEI